MINDEKAFLCALRDLMVHHGVEAMYPTYEGEICVVYENSDGYYDLGTIDEIEKEIERL